MNWFFFALIAAMLWALDNVLDKFILTKRLKDAYSYDILTNLNDIFPAILVLLIVPITFNIVFSTIAFLFGALTVFALLYYNKSMMKDEASRISSLEWTSPIFVAIIAFFLLNQTLSTLSYVGILLVVFGAVIVSREKIRKNKIIYSPVLGTILIFSFLSAIGDVVSDFSLNYINFLSFFFWASVGSVLSSVAMLGFPIVRKNFKREMKTITIKTFLMILSVSVFYYIAEVSFYVALSEGLVTLVSAIVATQPLFTFFYTLGLSFYKPRVLREKFDTFSLITKIIGIVVIICGVWLILS